MGKKRGAQSCLMPGYKNLIVLFCPPLQRARICACWPSLVVHQKNQKACYPHLTCRCWYESPYNNKDKYLSCHLRENGIRFFTSDDSDTIISQRLGRQTQINWGQRGKKENWKEINSLLPSILPPNLSWSISEGNKGTDHYLSLLGQHGIGKCICTLICSISSQGWQEGIKVPVSFVFHFILWA